MLRFSYQCGMPSQFCLVIFGNPENEILAWSTPRRVRVVSSSFSALEVSQHRHIAAQAENGGTRPRCASTASCNPHFQAALQHAAHDLVLKGDNVEKLHDDISIVLVFANIVDLQMLGWFRASACGSRATSRAGNLSATKR